MLSSLEERVATVARGYAVEDYGLTITGTLDERRWEQIGRELRRRSDSSRWALGDWLILGGRGEGGRWIGSGYARACEITGYGAAHLSNLFRVAEAYPRDRRDLGVSWSHYREALRLPESERMAALYEAAHEHVTLDAFAPRVDARLRQVQPQSSEAAPSPLLAAREPSGKPRHAVYQPREVQCPKCGHQFTVAGHKVSRAQQR